jgi:hypothetical protein
MSRRLCFDLLALEWKSPSDFLKENSNHVIFDIDKELLGIDRTYLQINKTAVFWSCVEPLEKFARLGLRGAVFVVFAEIEKVLKHDIRKISLVFEKFEPRLQSQDAYEAKLGSGISGKHCQETSGERIYRVSKRTLDMIASEPVLEKTKKTRKTHEQFAEDYASKYDVYIPTAELFTSGGRLKPRKR